MPLVKFDTSPEQYNFLQELLDNAEQIVEEYDDNKHKLKVHETPNCVGWHQTSPYRFGFGGGYEHLPILSKIISSALPKASILVVMISEVVSNLPQGVHQEEIPHGVRRFHIPIKYNPNARLNVLEYSKWNQYEWDDHNVFEFLNFNDPHYISCPGNDGNRIVLLIDVCDKNLSNQQLIEIKKWYDKFIIDARFYDVYK